MIGEDPKAVQDADAAIIAALLRLAVKSYGKLAVQDELLKIEIDLLGDRNYSDPFGNRISQVKQLAGLE